MPHIHSWLGGWFIDQTFSVDKQWKNRELEELRELLGGFIEDELS
jgi:hypothetical protein